MRQQMQRAARPAVRRAVLRISLLSISGCNAWRRWRPIPGRTSPPLPRPALVMVPAASPLSRQIEPRRALPLPPPVVTAGGPLPSIRRRCLHCSPRLGDSGASWPARWQRPSASPTKPATTTPSWHLSSGRGHWSGTFSAPRFLCLSWIWRWTRACLSGGE